MNEYVLGFLIDHEVDEWLGVLKEHGPPVNIGKWNGVGGKIEDGETALAAMVREGKEEVGGMLFDWEYLGMFGQPCVWNVVVFRAPALRWDTYPTANDIGEKLEWRDRMLVSSVLDNTARNLEWLIPMVFSPYVLKFDICEANY